MVAVMSSNKPTPRKQAVSNSKTGQGKQPGEIHRSGPCGTCLRRTNQRHGRHAGAHNRLGTRQSKDRDEEHRLQHAPPLPATSHQPKAGVKTARERVQIMLRITQTALNQGLRSETVRASSELTQQSSSLRVPNTLQADALASSSRNQLKIEVPL